MIEFPEGYFQEEVRQDFYIEPMMKRVWAAQLEVLEDFDRICKEHHLQYFADWGTLLGAVREHGFIPWDDDIDVAMKRQDFMKLLELAQTGQIGDNELVCVYTEPEYDNYVARFINSRIISLEPKRLQKYHNCPYSVGIDIDILDYKSRDKEADKLQLQMVEILAATVYSVTQYVDGEITVEELSANLEQVQQLCGVTLDTEQPLQQQLRMIEDQLCGIYTEEDSDELQYIPTRNKYNPNYYMPKEFYDEMIYVDFDVTKMPIPKGWDKILTMQFGSDYMTPKNVGGGHNYPFYRALQEPMLRKFLIENNISGELFDIDLEMEDKEC